MVEWSWLRPSKKVSLSPVMSSGKNSLSHVSCFSVYGPPVGVWGLCLLLFCFIIFEFLFVFFCFGVFVVTHLSKESFPRWAHLPPHLLPFCPTVADPARVKMNHLEYRHAHSNTYTHTHTHIHTYTHTIWTCSALQALFTSGSGFKSRHSFPA